MRRVAINALGNHAGTVVVMDPMTGKSLFDSQPGMGRATRLQALLDYQAGHWCCRPFGKHNSTFGDDTGSQIARDMDLTSALAHSDNPYFERVGGGIGFDKMIHYAQGNGPG